jgi:hypothetical protein
MSTQSGDQGGADSGDGDGYVCGYDDTTSTSDPCQFPVSGPDERCHMHPRDGDGPPEGHGSGSPDHQMGDGPGDITEKCDPETEKPAMTHGLNAVQDDPVGTLRYLEEDRPEAYDWVISKWESYLADAPFGRDTAKADDLLHACLMEYAIRGARDRQVKNWLTHTVEKRTDNGTPFDVEEELPVNLPANRLAREARSIKKDLGVLDDPESKKAEAMGWGAAAKKVAEKNDAEQHADDDVVDVDYTENTENDAR